MNILSNLLILIVSPIIKLLKPIFRISSSSDKAESVIKRYISTIILTIVLFIFIIGSRLWTQHIYMQKEEARKELEIVKGLYTKHKQVYQDYTRRSNLIEEAEKRDIDIEINDSPIVEIKD